MASTDFPDPDVYRISADGHSPPELLLNGDWLESYPKVSPDGRWLAYLSDERAARPAVGFRDGGVRHLFVRGWPSLSARERLTFGDSLSSDGARKMVWSKDSRTLFFQRGTRLWTATLEGGDDVTFEVRDTGTDFPGPIWDQHPDGRFLVHIEPQDPLPAEQARLVVVSNWSEALRRPPAN